MRFALGRAVSPPPHVQSALAQLFPDMLGVLDAVRVIEYSWLAWLHVKAVATTRRRRIYLRGSAASFFENPELMLHEYCHVMCQWETGRLSRRAYLREWLRNGYFENGFEVEARRFAQLHGERLRMLLHPSS